MNLKSYPTFVMGKKDLMHVWNFKLIDSIDCRIGREVKLTRSWFDKIETLTLALLGCMTRSCSWTGMISRWWRTRKQYPTSRGILCSTCWLQGKGSLKLSPTSPLRKKIAKNYLRIVLINQISTSIPIWKL